MYSKVISFYDTTLSNIGNIVYYNIYFIHKSFFYPFKYIGILLINFYFIIGNWCIYN